MEAVQESYQRLEESCNTPDFEHSLKSLQIDQLLALFQHSITIARSRLSHVLSKKIGDELISKAVDSIEVWKSNLNTIYAAEAVNRIRELRSIIQKVKNYR